MKRMIRCLILVFVLLFGSMQTVYVHAMLTEEEQIANRKKKEEAVSQTELSEEETLPEETEMIAETETAETRSETAETQSETEKAVEAETQSEKDTESQSETKAEDNEDRSDAPLIAINPSHQAPGFDMSGEEAEGPNSKVMKPRLTPGVSGTVSGWDEYELNLDICLKLKDELESRGYRVIMTRETHDVDLSSAQRCQMANEAGADILIHIHANSSNDSSISGAMVSTPSKTNPYVKERFQSCMKLSDDILNEYCKATDLKRRGIWINDNMTEINWSDIPVTVLELGYMSNASDDAYMADEANQDIMVKGIANGIDLYFRR